jgi:hypothetical protein
VYVWVVYVRCDDDDAERCGREGMKEEEPKNKQTCQQKA